MRYEKFDKNEIGESVEFGLNGPLALCIVILLGIALAILVGLDINR